MKRLIFLGILIVSLVACKESTDSDSNESDNSSSVEGGYTLQGQLKNGPEGKVYLRQLIGRNAIAKDSTDMDAEGNFEFTGKVEVVDFYQLVFPGNVQYMFVLENQPLEFSADYKDFQNTMSLEGSENTKVFYQITKEVNERNQRRNNLNQLAMMAQNQGNKGTMDSLTIVFNRSEQQSINNIKEIINNNTNSFIAAVGVMNFIDPAKEFAYMDSIAQVLTKNIPESRYVQDLNKMLNGMRKISIGQIAPEITQPNPEGQQVSLSQFKGKYVLIDFWASWCRPCRAENPNVVKTYNKYKNKNFEIFGVSLDKQKQRWIQAIDSDGLTWPQVSDLNGWQSAPAKKYSVRSIPATFLIDPEGKIIAKNLRGAELEKKLKEILG